MAKRPLNPLTVHRRVTTALDLLLEADQDLLRRNVGERAICGRLAVHLAPLFPRYDVDVEYDRHGLNRKELLRLPTACRGGGRRRVIPDVIIHDRGNDASNLVAIELKKSTNLESRACDFAKLRGLRRQLGYTYTAFIEVPAGGDFGRTQHILDWR
jgi:hypothetical protein